LVKELQAFQAVQEREGTGDRDGESQLGSVHDELYALKYRNI
jgi:hypothetical protein